MGKPRPGAAASPFRGSALEGVLDLLAGLLEVGAGLVGLALGLELLVVRRAADALLDLAAEFLGLVVDLVVESHRNLLWCGAYDRSITRPPGFATVPAGAGGGLGGPGVRARSHHTRRHGGHN